MSQLSLQNIVKVYPFTKPSGLFTRKKQMRALAQEKQRKHTTNEGVLALQDVSLEIEKGEFVVILGESGSGKSTLLRMIAGLESISAGEIYSDGKRMDILMPEERDIAMVFQEYALYSHLNVYNNIAYTLKNQHVPREEIHERVTQVLEDLELTPYQKRWPRELSGGQQQRVAIGRAIIRNPKFYLMDEPFSNLDPTMRAQLRFLVQKLHQKYGTTFLYVTHDQMEALQLGTKIVLLKDGIVQQIGTPQDLFHRPVDKYVASFVGSPRMNFLPPVALTQTKTGYQVNYEEAVLDFSLDKISTPLENIEQVIPAIRPVYITLEQDGLSAKVISIEHLGAEANLQLQTSLGELAVVVPARQVLGLGRGSMVNIAFDKNHFLFFDVKTEQRIL